MKAEKHQNGTGGLHGLYAVVLLIVMAVAVAACTAPAKHDYAGSSYCTKDPWNVTQACGG